MLRDDDVEEEDRSQDRGPQFVRAFAVEMHMDMSQEPFCAEISRENAASQSEHLDQAPALTLTVRTSQRGHNVWGTKTLENKTIQHLHVCSLLFQLKSD